MNNPSSSIACLALGSNTGDAKSYFEAAIKKLKAAGSIVRKSKLYRSKAANGAEQSDYCNAAILFQTSLPAGELLKLTQSIEQECGRTSKHDKSPRTLDIDIITYDDLIISESDLQIPHPRAHQRDFVLLPLNDVLPEWTHPVLQQSTQEMIDKLEEHCVLGIPER